jgi:phage terminase small subunit
MVKRMSLTRKQQAFADYYIETGNATEAAKKAGYSKKTADRIAYENLRKPEISAYIAQKCRPTDEKRIADAREVLEFFSAVMRGEVKDQFGLESALSDRLNAGKELMKRFDAGKIVPGNEKVEDDPLSKALREEAERMNNGDFA